MSNRKKSGFYREYLNDFKRSASGEYVYCGKTYIFCGSTAEKKRFITVLLGLCLLCSAFTLLPEIFDPVDMSRSFVTILPWAAQLICVFLAVWAAVRTILRINDLKEYVYKKTVVRLPRIAVAAAAFSIVTAASQIIYISVNGLSSKPFLTVIRIVFSLLSAVSCFLLYRAVKKSYFKSEN